MTDTTVTKTQVINWLRLAPAQDRRDVLLTLAGDATAREQRVQHAEDQLMRLCAVRGLDWNEMIEEEREAFINDLVHEDRSCGT